jgi:hypothetical protein
MTQVEALMVPGGASLGGKLTQRLSEARWTSLRAAVAFVKMSGVKHLAQPLLDFAKARPPGRVAIAIGIDQGGSSLEGVDTLFRIVDTTGNALFIVRNPRGVVSPTFHPKLWHFSNSVGGENAILLGSGNLTEGGLFTNYEAGVEVQADAIGDAAFVTSVNSYLTQCTDDTRGDVVRATNKVLQDLHDTGDLASESEDRRLRQAIGVMRGASAPGRQPASTTVFNGHATPSAPSAPPLPPLLPSGVTIRAAATFGPTPMPPVPGGGPAPAVATVPLPLHGVFYAHIKRANTTEIYMFKTALDSDPAFFGAPFRGLTTPKRAASWPQPQPDPLPLVSITVYDPVGKPVAQISPHPLKMWIYVNGPHANQDFRFTFPSNFLPHIPPMSVLMMTRNPVGAPGLQYALEVFPPGHARYQELNARCTQTVRNSTRRYGWS